MKIVFVHSPASSNKHVAVGVAVLHSETETATVSRSRTPTNGLLGLDIPNYDAEGVEKHADVTCRQENAAGVVCTQVEGGGEGWRQTNSLGESASWNVCRTQQTKSVKPACGQRTTTQLGAR